MREMKTPMQELLKLESDITHMFDSDLRVAMAILEHIRTNGNKMLEKEKEVIMDAYREGDKGNQVQQVFHYIPIHQPYTAMSLELSHGAEEYFEKTFNNKKI